MANNRLYIRCKACGEGIFIGKHFASELHLVNRYNPDSEGFVARLNRFYHDHYYCTSGRPYYLELCEEFAGEMTDTKTDYEGGCKYSG